MSPAPSRTFVSIDPKLQSPLFLSLAVSPGKGTHLHRNIVSSLRLYFLSQKGITVQPIEPPILPVNLACKSAVVIELAGIARQLFDRK
jgi:hypothetical protein